MAFKPNSVVTTDELIHIIRELKSSGRWTRPITCVHMHNTWKPNMHDLERMTDRDGERLALSKIQANMAAYHAKSYIARGDDDIDGHGSDWGYKTSYGVHLTCGLYSEKEKTTLWCIGRDFNEKPCSIGNHNTGAFGCEIVGNFDIGNDVFEGQRKIDYCRVMAAVFEVCELPLTDETFRLHRELTPSRTCPGTSIDKDDMMMHLKEALEGPETIDVRFGDGVELKGLDRRTVEVLKAAGKISIFSEIEKPKPVPPKKPPFEFDRRGSILAWNHNDKFRRGFIYRGQAVKDLQHALNLLGHNLEEDGIFGRGTDTAVRSLQREHKLTVDGLVGRGSETLINDLLEKK